MIFNIRFSLKVKRQEPSLGQAVSRFLYPIDIFTICIASYNIIECRGAGQC